MQETLANFLERALVWPDPDVKQPGWVNLHWRRHDQKGITGGRALKTYEETFNFIRWSQNEGKAHVADIYYCTSLQEKHGGPKTNGRFAAVRSIDNALSSRLLFADVDKYPSKLDAASDITRFCNESQSPIPSALVDSGGGLHVYWFLSTALPKDEWLKVATQFDALLIQYGLKHDNISTDMARILRPPETLNWKRADLGNGPQPVVLKQLNGDIDLNKWRSLHNAPPVKVQTDIIPSEPKRRPERPPIEAPNVEGQPSKRAFKDQEEILGGRYRRSDTSLQALPSLQRDVRDWRSWGWTAGVAPAGLGFDVLLQRSHGFPSAQQQAQRVQS